VHDDSVSAELNTTYRQASDTLVAAAAVMLHMPGT
jgi:hypothetical protein